MKMNQSKEEKIIPVRVYYDYLKEKISTKYKYEDAFHRRALSLVKPSPGFVTTFDSHENFSNHLCVLCCQLARDPITCRSCELRYCVKCIYYMIILFKLNNRMDPSVVNVINLIGHRFNCLTVTCPEISTTTEDLKAAEFKKFTVKCINPTCYYVGTYDDACYHSRQECQRKTDNFRFDIASAGEIFNSPDDTQIIQYNINRIQEQLEQDKINLENLMRAYYEKFAEYVAATTNKRGNSPHPDEPPQKQQKVSETIESSYSVTNKAQLRTRDWQEYSNYHSTPRSKRPELQMEDDQTLRIPQGWKKPRITSWVEQKSVTSSKNSDPQPQCSSLVQVAEDIDDQNTIDHNIEKEIIELAPEEANEIDSWENPDATTYLELNKPVEPSNSDYNYRSKTDKRRDARHRRAERERSHQLRLIHSDEEEEKSSTSSKKFSSSYLSEPKPYVPDAQGPTPKVEHREKEDFKTEISYRDFVRRHRNPAKHNLKERNRKLKIHQEILQEKRNKVIKIMAPPRDYATQIGKAIVKAKDAGLTICAIDMENTKIKLKDGTTTSVPLWIAIIDGSLNVIYHEFVRHPTSSLIDKDFGTEWHGLTKKDVNQAKPFNHVRKEVIDFLRRYDRIIVSGQTGDFVSLFISINDHLQLLPKIVCVSSYYNCRIANDALGLKFASFLMFNTILQDEAHSPLVDAAFTLYLYLIDFDRIEHVKSQLLETRNMNQGFRGYVYPKNPNMQVF